MNSRLSWTIPTALLVAGFWIAGRVDSASAFDRVKGDEATYVAMAASVSFDGDFEYDLGDYARMRRWYPHGPEGIFLKRDATGALRFAKAYVYGVFAAPFARGGLRGLLLFNALWLVASVLVGWAWLRRRWRSLPALLFSLLFVLGASTGLYAAWLTPEVLNYALVFLAFCLAWRPTATDRPSRIALWTGVVLLALATFSKPLTILLAVPLVLGSRYTSLRETVVYVGGFGLLVACCFTLNVWITGDWNYQGGDRKTFYGRFPYDEDGTTFDTGGIARATDALDVPIGDEGRLSVLPRNTLYFLVGRHFGLISFGWPPLVTILVWAVATREKVLREWALVAAVAVTAAVTMVWMPYTWFGGGGPIGNRYFTPVAAALFFLLPVISMWRSLAVTMIAAAGLLVVGPLYASPFEVARRPWVATQNPVSRLFPIEMTGASDLPIVLDTRRGRVPQGRSPTLFVAYMDRLTDHGRNGWIAVPPGSRSDLLVRSPQRLQSVLVGIKTRTACMVRVRTDAESQEVSMSADDRADITVTPVQTFSLESFAFLVTVEASSCSDVVEIAMQGRV